MNKTDFIKTVADKAQLTQKDTKAVYEAIVETIHDPSSSPHGSSLR